MKTIWFMKGYSNLYNAISDLKKADTENKYQVLCSHDNKGFVGFESADFVEIEPSINSNDFIQFCLETVKKYNVKVIFASNKQYILNKNKHLFKEIGAEIVTAADYTLINSINNKAKLYKMLQGNDVVKIPDFEVFENDKEFNKSYHKLKKNHKQLCMKPIQGVYGIGFYVLKEKTNQLKNILSQNQILSINSFKKNISKRKFSKMMMMQFLEGAERSVDCVAYHGKFVGGVIRKKIASNLPQVIEDNPELIAQAKWITEKLKLNGMFNIQFRDSGGEHYLLEINPRLSGRSFYATIAGFNIPYIAAEIFSGEKKPEEISYKINNNILISAITKGVVSNNHSIDDIANFVKKSNKNKESK